MGNTFEIFIVQLIILSSSVAVGTKAEDKRGNKNIWRNKRKTSAAHQCLREQRLVVLFVTMNPGWNHSFILCIAHRASPCLSLTHEDIHPGWHPASSAPSLCSPSTIFLSGQFNYLLPLFTWNYYNNHKRMKMWELLVI